MNNISNLLKGFVIVGGIVLVAGTMLLVVMILLRGDDERPAEAPATPTTTATPGSPRTAERCPGGPPPSEPVSVALPAGARIEQVVPDGACLILLGVDAAGRQFVATVDPLTGARISLLLIRPDG